MPFGFGDRFSVDANILQFRVDPRSKFGNDLAIDFDPTFKNVSLAFSTAPDSGRSQYLLESGLGE